MLSHLSFFLHFFLTYLLPYLSFTFRIDPLRFQARCRNTRLNLALFFMVILCCCTFLSIGEHVFVSPSSKIGSSPLKGCGGNCWPGGK